VTLDSRNGRVNHAHIALETETWKGSARKEIFKLNGANGGTLTYGNIEKLVKTCNKNWFCSSN
jgi:hypothetical protein